jgi:hypothetical protein
MPSHPHRSYHEETKTIPAGKVVGGPYTMLVGVEITPGVKDIRVEVSQKI